MAENKRENYFDDSDEGHVNTREKTSNVKTKTNIWDAIWESTSRDKP